MTRIEKNKSKKHILQYRRWGTISTIMFTACMVLGMVVAYKGFNTDIVFISFAIFYMLVGFGCAILGTNCEMDINNYRKNLRLNRHKNLLRIGVEAVVNKNRNKAIDIQKMMTIGDYKIFLKGFILSADKLSSDDHIVAIANSNLKDLY